MIMAIVDARAGEGGLEEKQEDQVEKMTTIEQIAHITTEKEHEEGDVDDDDDDDDDDDGDDDGDDDEKKQGKT